MSENEQNIEEVEENIIDKTCRELNLTKAQLAKKLDVSPSSITDWQTKIPKMTKLALELLVEVEKKDYQLKVFKEAHRIASLKGIYMAETEELNEIISRKQELIDKQNIENELLEKQLKLTIEKAKENSEKWKQTVDHREEYIETLVKANKVSGETLDACSETVDRYVENEKAYEEMLRAIKNTLSLNAKSNITLLEERV